MPKLLTIPDVKYKEAVSAVLNLNSSLDASYAQIEAVIRKYVQLALTKKISDWSYKLTEDDRVAIADLVSDAKSANDTSLSAMETYVILNMMETLAANGEVFPNIARPRAAQVQYEKDQETGFQNTPGTAVKKGIEDFFGVMKTGAESVMKGLGFNIPIELIIILVVLLAAGVIIPRR